MDKKEKAAVILLTVFVWGLAGALFGSLFAGLHEVLEVLGLEGWQSLVVGAAAAAMTTSAFYSAMPTALVGAMAGVLASIAYLMATGHRMELIPIAGAAGLVGIFAGLFYTWMTPGGGRPLAETLTGLLAGISAGVLVWLGLAVYGGEVGILPVAAGVVAVVGTLFKLSERWVVGALSGLIPRVLSAPVVAGLIAAVVGSAVWLMGGITAAGVDPITKGAVHEVLHQVPAGFLGGMLGGAVTGLVLELLGMHLEDDEHVV